MADSPFQNGKSIVLDGGLASELEKRGYDLNHALWSTKTLIEAPEAIFQVHLDYLKAGSDMVITSSYQLSFEGIEKHRQDLPCEETTVLLLERSVDLACAARQEASKSRATPSFVACSVGPYGAWTADGSEYTGIYDADDASIAQFHRRRFKVLDSLMRTKPHTADFVACETIPCLREAKIIESVIKEFPKLKAWLSFSCCDEGHCCAGDTIEECALVADRCEQFFATGVNCTNPNYVCSLLKKMGKVTSKPLLCYPNSGEVWDAASKSWQMSPTGHQSESEWTEFYQWSQEWTKCGAQMIGGCCRTGPQDIASVVAGLQDM